MSDEIDWENFDPVKYINELEKIAEEKSKTKEDLAIVENERKKRLDKQKITAEFLLQVESAVYREKTLIIVPKELDNEVFRVLIRSKKLMKLLQLFVECPVCERREFEYFNRQLYPRLCEECFIREANYNCTQFKE